MQIDPLKAFLLTNLIGAIGGLILYRLKVPAGAMIGAMLSVMALGILSGAAYYPDQVRTYVQIASGILIGSRINRKDIGELKQVIVPSLLLLVGMFILNLSFAYLFARFGNLDINTALFAGAPGGMSDMALIAEDLGANTAQVAMMQLVRILFVISLFPLLFKWLAGRGWRLIRPTTGDPCVQKPAALDSAPLPAGGGRIRLRSAAGSLRVKPEQAGQFLLTLLVAWGGGMALSLLDVPAGAMIGSMLATAIFGVSTGKVFFPTRLRPAIQISVGAFLGARMTMESLLSLQDLLVPAGIMLLGMLAAALGFGYLIHRLTGLPLSTCFLASTPGGLAEMSLIAEELGCDAPKVAVMHTFRLIMVILLFPVLLRMLSGLLTA